jgi:fumarate hydratase class I
MCQDTRHRDYWQKKGQRVWVDDEEEALSYGPTYTETNFALFANGSLEHVPGGQHWQQPASATDIYAAPARYNHADEFHLMFVAKGGGAVPTNHSCSRKPQSWTPENLKFL